MKKMLVLMLGSSLLFAGCSGEFASTSDCVAGDLVYDYDKTPDWEIDTDGDCEGDIELVGNETKTTKKPPKKIPTKAEVQKKKDSIKLSKPVKAPTKTTVPKTSTPKVSSPKPISTPKVGK